MSKKNTLRKDKTCLNCNYVVDNRFCPNCGQENIDTRKTFSHLFIHFFEDLTHYENAFWKTIKNLILRPASLTKEYLSGKRMSYLAPVRLYIFISFITFFIVSILPNDTLIHSTTTTKTNGKVVETKDNIKLADELTNKQLDALMEKENLTQAEVDSLKKLVKEQKTKSGFLNFGYHSVEQMDSIRKIKPDEINDFEYWLNSKTIKVGEENTKEQLIEKFKESFIHNLPKTLFIYMPLFAFILWLFQNKKKWFYFDHGIFTLHYFSFLLLLILILGIKRFLLDIYPNSFFYNINRIINFLGIIYMFYYFFPAHHRFYGETRIVSFLKGIAMFIINIIFIILILIALAVYSFISIH